MKPQDRNPTESTGTGRNPDGTFGKGNSANPGGQPKWVKAARDAMRDELWPLAQRHLRRVLSGEAPRDTTPTEDALYADVTVEDRTTAAKLVVEYTLPKPKQSVSAKVDGDFGGLVVQVVTQPKE